MHLQHLKPLDQVDQAGNAGDRLGQIGGERGAEHPGIEYNDKKQVQPHVQHTGNDKKDQRGAAVTQCPHDACHHVVQKHKGDAGKDPSDVGDCIADDVRRRLHQLQDRPRQQNRGGGQHHRTRQAQPGRVCNVPTHIAVVFRAEKLCNGNGKPVAHADHKAQDHIIDRAGGAHRRQRVHADETPDNNGVGQAVKLLEQVAQYQRKGKPQNHLEWMPSGQILCHILTSSISPIPAQGAPLLRNALYYSAIVPGKSRGLL